MIFLELKNENKKFNKKLLEVDEKIKNVCENHSALDSKVDVLNHKINYLQQKELNNDLLITGLLSTSGEHLVDTVLKYFKKLDKSITNTNIEYVYRFKSPVLGKTNHNNCPPVVVRFSTYSVKKNY